MTLRERYFLEFLPEHDFTSGWSDGPTFTVHCPICGHDYTHAAEPLVLDSEDRYLAWAGRGDCIKIPFEGECGHRFVLCIGYHKGKNYAFWETSS